MNQQVANAIVGFFLMGKGTGQISEQIRVSEEEVKQVLEKADYNEKQYSKYWKLMQKKIKQVNSEDQVEKQIKLLQMNMYSAYVFLLAGFLEILEDQLMSIGGRLSVACCQNQQIIDFLEQILLRNQNAADIILNQLTYEELNQIQEQINQDLSLKIHLLKTIIQKSSSSKDALSTLIKISSYYQRSQEEDEALNNIINGLNIVMGFVDKCECSIQSTNYKELLRQQDSKVEQLLNQSKLYQSEKQFYLAMPRQSQIQNSKPMDECKKQNQQNSFYFEFYVMDKTYRDLVEQFTQDPILFPKISPIDRKQATFEDAVTKLEYFLDIGNNHSKNRYYDLAIS